MASPGAASDVIAVGAASSWSAAPGAVNHANGIYLAPFSRPRRSDVRCGSEARRDRSRRERESRSSEHRIRLYDPQRDLDGRAFAAGSIALALEAWAGSSPTPAAVQNAVEASAEDYGPVGQGIPTGVPV